MVSFRKINRKENEGKKCPMLEIDSRKKNEFSLVNSVSLNLLILFLLIPPCCHCFSSFIFLINCIIVLAISSVKSILFTNPLLLPEWSSRIKSTHIRGSLRFLYDLGLATFTASFAPGILCLRSTYLDFYLTRMLLLPPSPLQTLHP